MATLYNIKNILVAREDSAGVVVANPTLLQLCLTENSLKDARTYEEAKCLLNDTGIDVETGSEVSGTLKFKMDADSQAFIITHVFGEKDSLADATAASWAADTVMATGDIVNHSGGKYSLVVTSVKGDGKTGGTEPTITKRDERIADNNVTLISIPKLITSVHSFKETSPKFTIEVALENTTDSTVWYKQIKHLELDDLPIALGEDGFYEITTNPKGGVGVDADSDSWVSNLEAIAGAKVVKANSDFYGGDCSLTSVLIDGVIDATNSLELNINKGLTTENGLNCRVTSSRDTKMEGSLVKDFTPDDYTKFKERATFTVDATLKTKVGASCVYSFPQVRPKFADPDYESKTSVMISPEIKAEKPDSGSIATATVTYPSLMDDTGNIIGDGSW